MLAVGAGCRGNRPQPATSNQQPATSNQQPATSNQQPATSNQQPATSNQQPATSYALRSMQPVYSGLLFSTSGTGALTSDEYVPPLWNVPLGNTDSELRPY